MNAPLGRIVELAHRSRVWQWTGTTCQWHETLTAAPAASWHLIVARAGDTDKRLKVCDGCLVELLELYPIPGGSL